MFSTGCSYFEYELTPWPMALFKDGCMRKPDKANLAKSLTAGMPSDQLPSCVRYVLDGGSLLHQIKWSKNNSFGQLVKQYCSFVTHKYGSDAVVVFDGYIESPTTKDHEHHRRTDKGHANSPIVVLNQNTPLLFVKQSFLGNERNKDSFIKMLMEEFQDKGTECIQSVADADVDIVAVALKEATKNDRPVAVVADDTDILVLLTYHAGKDMSDIYFVSEAKRWQLGQLRPVNVQKLQDHVGMSVCRNILLIHAFSGCDTTSALFSHGKGQILKRLSGLEFLSQITAVMENADATTEDIAEAGIQLMVAAYSGTKDNKLSTMQYQSYCNKVCVSVTSLIPEKFPPTERESSSIPCFSRSPASCRVDSFRQQQHRPM